MQFVFCRFYGLTYTLPVQVIDMSRKPNVNIICGSDFLRMMPNFNVGAAQATYPLREHLLCANADFKPKLIERISPVTWRYTFEDSTGHLFEVNLNRRQYAVRHCEGVSAKRQSAKLIRS